MKAFEPRESPQSEVPGDIMLLLNFYVCLHIIQTVAVNLEALFEKK